MFKFLMEEKRRNDLLFTGVTAKRQCQCDNDFEKKSLQEENNQLQKRVTELERIVISGDFKAKPNIIRQKDKRSQVSVDDEEGTDNSDKRLHKEKKTLTLILKHEIINQMQG